MLKPSIHNDSKATPRIFSGQPWYLVLFVGHVVEPSEIERRQFRVLTLFALVWTLFAIYGESNGLCLLYAVPPGKATILAAEDSEGQFWGGAFEERGPISPRKVHINTADEEFLTACPGIGKALAGRIIAERSRGRFLSWKDFDDRVKGISGSKIAGLRESGVTLDP